MENPIEPNAVSTPVTVVKPAKKASTKKVLSVIIILVVIIVPLFAALATAGLAASNRGKNNSFSALAGMIPTEKLPLINKLGKTDYQLLRDAVAATADYKLLEKIGGTEQKSDVTVSVAGTDSEGRKMDVNLTMSSTVAMGKSSEAAKLKYTMGGNVRTGIVNVDLGNEGFKADVLMPNPNKLFMSFDLSQSMIDTIEPELNASGLTSDSLKIKDYLGKFYKLDLIEYYKDVMPESEAVDYAKVNEATKEFMVAIEPDFRKLYNETYGDFETYSTITNGGREKVAGRTAVVLDLKLKEDKVAGVTARFVDGMVDLINNHKSDLVKFCKDAMLDQANNGECSVEDLKTEKLTDANKEELEKGVKEMFEAINLSTLRFYVDAVDNTILKFDMTIQATAKGLESITNGSADKVNKIEVKLTSIELSRGNDITIIEPTDATDLNKMIKDMMNSYQDTMSAPAYDFESTEPSYDDAELEKLLQELQQES